MGILENNMLFKKKNQWASRKVSKRAIFQQVLISVPRGTAEVHLGLGILHNA